MCLCDQKFNRNQFRSVNMSKPLDGITKGLSFKSKMYLKAFSFIEITGKLPYINNPCKVQKLTRKTRTNKTGEREVRGGGKR